jgi:hypothetical protein
MKRTFTIGDIHGGLKALKQLISKLDLTANDTLIFLGDYVDGWSESAQVLDYLIELDKNQKCIFIKGNHDVYCENWLKSGVKPDKWFYTTDNCDIGIKEVKPIYLTDKPNERTKQLQAQYPAYFARLGKLIFLTTNKEDANSSDVEAYINGLPADKKANLKKLPKFMYQVEFEKPGGLVMPIIVELTYADGTKKREVFPPQIWNKDDNKVFRVFTSTKEITKITVDPDEETADVDMSNNAWPKKEESKFNKFKNKMKN